MIYNACLLIREMDLLNQRNFNDVKCQGSIMQATQIRTGNRNEHDGFLVEFLKLEISALEIKV